MKLYLLLALLCLPYLCVAQRNWGVCDSTTYALNADTAVVAARKKLYLHTAGGTTLLRDFAMADTNYYIRDFDIIKPSLWYTLVGSRYIGSPTHLYRSTNGGRTWQEDTSFYPATRYHATNAVDYYNSINSVQRMGRDSIALFVGYYESGIAYSTNGGNSWQQWFRNLQTHYQGILECAGYYYLYGSEGDALPPWMFPFQKKLLFSPDTAGAWDMLSDKFHPRCTGSVDPDCIYGPPSISLCALYNYFTDALAGACSLLPTKQPWIPTAADGMLLSPNPATDYADVLLPPLCHIATATLYDATGKIFYPAPTPVSNNTYRLPLGGLPAGMYCLRITTTHGQTMVGRMELTH